MDDCHHQSAVQIDLRPVDAIVARLGIAAHALIPILQAIQEHYHYLPEPALRRVCELTDITPQAMAGVSSFFSQFRHKPAGRHIVRICHGTACHVKGSELVHEAIARHLKLTDGHDTDVEGEFTVERVGCLGCCTLAPVVQVDSTTLGHVTPDEVGHLLQEASFKPVNATRPEPSSPADGHRPRSEIRVGVGSCCIAGGSQAVRSAFERAVHRLGADAVVKPVGCVGMCHQTPMVEIVRDQGPSILYTRVSADAAEQIVRRHFPTRNWLTRLRGGISDSIDRLLLGQQADESARRRADVRDAPICDFLGGQVRIATEYCGHLDPLDLDEYVAHGGFAALRQIINGMGAATPSSQSDGIPVADFAADIIRQVSVSGLRGRGGAGFPTGRKWQAVHSAPGPRKFVIVNGDEGDPGAFMDRMILESYPYRVLEGMLIAALAVGAHEGRLYIRHEYPLAVKRIGQALAILRMRGYIGKSILESGHAFEVEICEGAGAFVCGEETAMIASIEGQRGTPRLRPPFPAERGLWDCPTLINNVETLAQVPWILRSGGEAFAAMGTGQSKGTKVFALTGKVVRGGLIEVPMGVTIRRIVQEIGGGVEAGRTFKAVQIGGPSGGCLPAELADTPIDYESLAAAGAIMGSGGLVVLDDTDCMVDIARYFLQFTQAESCGKCTFCRIGTRRMLEILDRFCQGNALPSDLTRLELLANQVKAGSLCGLGQTAPNPILTTLRYFRHEYEAHLRGQCPAGRCKALIHYQVQDTCIGCTKCAQQCPVSAIPMTPYAIHHIDDSICTRCDVCRTACPVDAIKIVTGKVHPAAPATPKEPARA